MKAIKNYLKLGLGVVALSALASCTAESGYLTKPEQGGAPEVNLVKDAEVNAYSGGRALEEIASTYGVDVNGNLWYQNWDRPTNVTEDEIAKIKELMSEPRVGAVNDIHIDWENYWVQQVYTGEAEYKDGYEQNIGTGSSHMNHLLAYSNQKKVQNVVTWWDEETQGPIFEYEIKDKDPWEDVYEHINNFNKGSNNTVYTDDETGEKYYGTTLMTDMYAEGIVDQFGYHNSTDSKNHFEYIIVEMDGSYYICFDFYATHPEGQDANKNMDVERDWIFNDWIVKISPAYLKGTTPEVKPDPDEPTTPDGPVVSDDNAEVVDHVEVNLSVEEHGGYLASHLSIHVRAVTDVKVVIPVKEDYYIDADDLAIVQQHHEGWMLHGGPKQVIYEDIIPGHSITLNFEYNENEIVVWTDGIDAEIISYLRETFNDGITFEIWTYVNSLDLKETLKADLNKATIEFLDAEPDLYVNAFMYDPQGSGDIFGDDCTVSIVGSQKNDYKDGEASYWYNKSPYNQLYWKNK